MKIAAKLSGTFLAGIGVILCVLLFLPKNSEVPEQTVEVGRVLQMPCEEHGSHAVTVTSTQIVRTYNLSRDDGAEAVFTQDELLQFIAELGQ